MIYSGISYINNEKEKLIKDKVLKESLLTNIERDIDEKQLQGFCSTVADWLVLLLND
jgi:hypothetical protein